MIHFGRFSGPSETLFVFKLMILLKAAGRLEGVLQAGVGFLGGALPPHIFLFVTDNFWQVDLHSAGSFNCLLCA